MRLVWQLPPPILRHVHHESVNPIFRQRLGDVSRNPIPPEQNIQHQHRGPVGEPPAAIAPMCQSKTTSSQTGYPCGRGDGKCTEISPPKLSRWQVAIKVSGLQTICRKTSPHPLASTPTGATVSATTSRSPSRTGGKSRIGNDFQMEDGTRFNMLTKP